MSLAADLTRDLSLPVPSEWIDHLPDGAVSIETDGRYWVLRASHQVQSRFENLLESRKQRALSEPETREYDAICDLDQLLSGFNRLARSVQRG